MWLAYHILSYAVSAYHSVWCKEGTQLAYWIELMWESRDNPLDKLLLWDSIFLSEK